MAFQTVFDFGTFQDIPLTFQIDKPRHDTDKDKEHGKAKLQEVPPVGEARVEE